MEALHYNFPNVKHNCLVPIYYVRKLQLVLQAMLFVSQLMDLHGFICLAEFDQALHRMTLSDQAMEKLTLANVSTAGA